MNDHDAARKKLLNNQLAERPEAVTLADFDAGVTLNPDGSAHVRLLDLRGMRAALEEFKLEKEINEALQSSHDLWQSHAAEQTLEVIELTKKNAELEAEVAAYREGDDDALHELKERLFEMQNAAIDLAKKNEELEAEVAGLKVQRRFLVDEARSFRRIAKEMSSPCHIFFTGDRVHKVMNAVRDEMAKAERREYETRINRDAWKASLKKEGA